MSPSHFRPGRVAADPRIRKPSRFRFQVLAGAGAVLLGVLTAGTGMVPDAAFAAPAKSAPVAAAPDFGPNVRIFDPIMPVADIQAAVDAVTATQVNDEMGPNRYSLLYKPGTHGSAEEPLIIQVGRRRMSRSTVTSTSTTAAGRPRAVSRWIASGARCRISRST